MTVELQESTKASEIVALASTGEEVVLTRGGKIVGRFKAESESSQANAENTSRRFGFLKKPDYTVTADLDEGGREEIFYSDSTAEAPRLTAEQASNRLGFLKSKGYQVPDDIKTPFKEQIEEMFYGNPDKFKR